MKIIFDFDGTLVDSMPKLRYLAVELISWGHNLSLAEADKRYMSCIGRSFDDQLEHLWPGDPANARIADSFHYAQAAEYTDVNLHAGVLETIEFLNTTPFKYGVCSSTRGSIIEEVVKFLIPEFKGAVTGRESGKKQSQLRRHFTHTDVPSRWFIGDAPYDAEIAHRGRAHFIGVSHTFPASAFASPFPCAESVPQAVDEVMRSLPAPLQMSLTDRQPIRVSNLKTP